MARKRFVRRCTNYYLKLGRKEKKKQKWRKQRGRHSKIRTRQKGRPVKVQIGFGTAKKEKYKINGKIPILVKNLKGLSNVDRTKNIVIIAKVGKRKREEIIKKASENKIEILNKEKK